MTKYSWQQRYGIDRFDLEGPRGRIIGWIVGTPDKYSVIESERNFLGYVTAYIVRPQYGQKINWTWKIWWMEIDENGRYKKTLLQMVSLIPRWMMQSWLSKKDLVSIQMKSTQ